MKAVSVAEIRIRDFTRVVDEVERAIDDAVSEEREACGNDVKSLVDDSILCRVIVDAFYSRGAR